MTFPMLLELPYFSAIHYWPEFRGPLQIEFITRFLCLAQGHRSLPAQPFACTPPYVLGYSSK
jgi:hypothetical protein